MTNTMPPPPSAPGPTTAREAKGQAKAAKAYAKAQRPFWKKKRVILPTLLLLLIVVISLASAGGDDKPTTATVGGASAAGVDKGFGSKNASADVVVNGLDPVDVLGFRKPNITITNNSSKRSNYSIELSLESADGKTQYDSTFGSAQNVEPGQSTAGSVVTFTKSKTAPADAVVKVKSVSRTAA